MLRQYEADKDSSKTVHLLKAVQWTRKAWDEVTGRTIRKCWWKSTIIKKPIGQPQDLVKQQEQVLAIELQAQIA
jgi:hypothetical protein